MTFNESLSFGKEFLEANEVMDARVDAWLLMAYVCDIDRNFLLLNGNEDMEEEQRIEYMRLIERRAKHVPLQQITGKAYFYGLDFIVNQHVLTPRADTETLIEKTLPLIKDNDRILDMCTGSGCILLTLLNYAKRKNKENVTGLGADISREALNVAKENGSRLCPEAEFIHSNLFEKVEGKFNVIVSNPPYINTDVIDCLMPEVKDHEPHLALDGGRDGMVFYKRIVDAAPLFLYDGGWLIFEIGYDQGERVSKLMSEKGFMEVQVIKDLGGNDRVVAGHL